MADPAAGSTDRSVQVKLVLLGAYSASFPRRLSPVYLPGEAAVGKSSVVLRFVCLALSLAFFCF